MISRPLAIAITILVAVVWAGSVVVGMLYPDRDLAGINAIFAIVVGASFGLVPKRQTLATARRRLAQHIAGDEPPAAGSEQQSDDPAGGDGS